MTAECRVPMLILALSSTGCAVFSAPRPGLPAGGMSWRNEGENPCR
jgi:hypothetical protein